MLPTPAPPVYPVLSEEGSCLVGANCAIVSKPVRVNRSSGTNETVVIFEPPISGGNGTCSGGLFDELSGSARTCQAGCCVERSCTCRDGYVGARCDVQLRCGAAASADATVFDLGARDTVETRGTCNPSLRQEPHSEEPATQPASLRTPRRVRDDPDP